MADDNDQKPGDEKSSDAKSRAGQFLNGPVTQAFCSPDQAGYRCATQTPGCEPTGFTGQCTKQPEVGGAWPCITAIPHCAEPTGFTGKCTNNPWPNPTRYVGCTVLHCPTNDLTHRPEICRVVERGLLDVSPRAQVQGMEGPHPTDPPGCDYNNHPTDPPGCDYNNHPTDTPGCGPDTTRLLGCGYTQNWGLCPTHLLGCGYTKQWGPHCPPPNQQDVANAQGPQHPTDSPICYPTVPTHFLGCGFTKHWGPHCPPPNHALNVPPTEPPDCGGQVGAATIFNNVCNVRTAFCPQPVTSQPWCVIQHFTQRCPEFTPGCPWITPRVTPVDPGPVFRGGGGFGGGGGFVGAAAPAGGAGAQADVHITLLTFPPQFCAPTPATRCFICPPQQQHSPLPWFCPPSPWCPPSPAFPWCPPRSIGIACTIVQCHPTLAAEVGAAAPTPSAVDACPTRIHCPTYPNGDCTFFGCGPYGGGGGGEQVGAAPAGIWPTPGTHCRVCDPMQAAAVAPTPSAVDACPTRFHCPTYPNGDCTFFGCNPYGGGGGGGHTQNPRQCPSIVDACPTRLCGGGGEVGAQAIGTWPTPQTRCFVCDPMQAAAAAPTPSAVDACPTRFNCPTYPNGDCTFFGCNPYGGGGGGHTQNPRQCPSIVDACPTRLCGGGGGEQVGAAAITIAPTPATRCFICPPPYDQTIGNWPTPMTRCFIC